MTTYRVYLSGVVSTVVKVEIDPAELGDGEDPRGLAVEKAFNLNRASLCHHCNQHMEPPGEWHAGNWTQDPEDLDTMVEVIA